jgi:hypothetical protein
MNQKSMKLIREALLELSQSLDRMAKRAITNAKYDALAALDGDPKATANATANAKANRAQYEAYVLTMEKVDDIRHALERGGII